VRVHQRRWVARRFARRNNKWFAALEQSGLSGCNFLYSLLIIQLAGVSDLGVYSFWFVVCQFMGMLTIGLSTRQMVLQFSDEPFAAQRRGFATTCRLVAGLQLAQAALIGGMVMIHPPTAGALVLWLALTAYSASLNYAELFRQYYYLRSRQRLSFWFSATSLTFSTAAFVLFMVVGSVEAPELSAFWFLALGNLGFVYSAHRALSRSGAVAAPRLAEVIALCRTYWKPGIPATGGMLVTWMQNQSATPLLMFMLGPLWVGYYSLARMIVMPVNMLTAGLSKSALPQIRRAFGDGDGDALERSIEGHRRTNLNLVYGYVVLVGLVWGVGRYFGRFKAGDALIPMFVATVLVLILSNLRFWKTQHFVVRMRFGLLLRLGIYASAVTVAMMLGGGLVLESAFWVVLAPALGEVLLILMLRHHLRKLAPVH